jgi:hypothetical protein
MFAFAAPNALLQRAAFAQIPEAPGTIIEPDGEIEDEVPVEGMPRWKRPQPQAGEPAPDPARDTIDELQRARARASGTPESEPTPSFSGTE